MTNVSLMEAVIDFVLIHRSVLKVFLNPALCGCDCGSAWKTSKNGPVYFVASR